MVNFKKGDTVVVLAGDDKGKKGKVLRVLPKEGKALVEGINLKKDHLKPRQQGKKGQVVDKAAPVVISNLQISK
jgi:large subunit ribosomal protein L24